MPRTRSIFPTDPRTAATTDRLLRYCIYEIVEARPQPKVDLTRTLKHSLLPARLIPRFTQWQRRYTVPAGVVFLFAQFVSCTVLVTETRIARHLAMLSFAMQLPLLLFGYSALCTDVIVELTKTFEFWFFTFANTASVVIMAMYFNDLRAIGLVAAWLGVQFNICIDAALRGFVLTIVLLLVAIVCQSFALVMVALGAVRDVTLFRIANYGAKTVNSDDFLVSTLSTVIYMLTRSLFRRIATLRRHTMDTHGTESTHRLVRCVSYRCAVKLRPITNAFVSKREDAEPKTTAKTTTSSTPPQGRIRFVEIQRTFDSRETMLCGRNLAMIRVPQWAKVLIHAIGALGLSLTGLMFLILNYVRPYPAVARGFAIASPVLTVIYCFICISMYHPALLKQLCWTVDFAFISAQFLFGHVCAAYLFEWDDRMFVLASSFCWVLLMLTIDAFTPAARDRIGFRLYFIVPILVLSTTAHVLIAIEVTRSVSPWCLRDHSIFRVAAFNHEFDLHVRPAFFNRVWMLILWEMRALWRILKASRHDLVIIHGAVDLDIGPRRRRASVVALPSPLGPHHSLTQIQPVASSNSFGRLEYSTAASVLSTTSRREE